MLNKNESWSFLNKTVGLFGNSLILLVISKYLESYDVALWYTFIAIFGVVAVVEFGLMQIISRHIIYILNGKETHVDIDVNDFIKINSRIIFSIVAVISFVALICGYFYLDSLDIFNRASENNVSWLLFIVGSTMLLLSNFYAAIAVGFQRLAHVQKNQIFSVLTNLCFVSLLVVVEGAYNVRSITVAFALSQTLLFYLNYRLARDRQADNRSAVTFTPTKLPEPSLNKNLNATKIKSLIFSDAKKVGLNFISFKILTSGFFILLTLVLSDKELASYGLTTQLITYVGVFSMIFLSSNFPTLSKLFSEKKYMDLKKLYKNKALVSMFVYILFISLSIISFSYIQGVLNLKTGILTGELLYLFLLFSCLEFFLNIIGTILLACNELRMMPISFVSSVVMIFLAYIFVSFDFRVADILLLRCVIDVFFMLIPAVYIAYYLQRSLSR